MFHFFRKHRRFPFRRQSDAMDCGPACLQMMALHYGKHFTLPYLREICDTSRQGVTFEGLDEAARQLGFKTLAATLPLETLVSKAPLPCILHWDNRHFVVAYAAGPHFITVADPAMEHPVQYTPDDLLRYWQLEPGSNRGRAIFLEPTETFYAREDKPEQTATLRHLLPYLHRHRQQLLPVVLTLLAAITCSLAIPLLTQAIVDKGIQQKSPGLLLMICLGQLMLFTGRMTMDYLRARHLFRIGVNISIQLQSAFLHRLMLLPIPFFDRRHAGDNIQRISDNHRVEEFMTGTFVNTIFSMLTVLVMGSVLCYYNWKIFLLFLAGSALSAIWAHTFREKRRVIDQQKFQLLSENQQVLMEVFNAMQEIRLTGSEAEKTSRWQALQENTFRVKMKSLQMDQYMQGVSQFINESKNIITTFIAAMLVLNGHITLGAMLAVTYICGQLNAPVLQLAEFIRASQDTRFSLQRMQEIQDEPAEDQPSQAILPEEMPAADLIMKNISFRYGNRYSPLVLKDVSLHIPAGKVTAIVGMSGSGKTTLIKLLLKYYAPAAGSIYAGKMPLESINARSWRKHCGVVMQDGYVFMDTIANNIWTGAEVKDPERMVQAAQLACLHDFIASLPAGYDTPVGSHGTGLSEGQTQRLLLARLIYRQPSYLFLDEATNSLDANNERMIIQHLQTFFRGRTVVVVAHRLSTVRYADQIIVMDKGRIVENGDHDTLAARQGAYYRLVKNQLELGK